MLLVLGLGFLLGCFLGSFLNVCVHRLPRNESVVHPGSRCYGCGTPVQWYDNLPVISYLLLRGRCRWCGSGFSPRYLIVEVMTGLLCAAVAGYVFLADWAVPGYGQPAIGLPLTNAAYWERLGLVGQAAPWMGDIGLVLAAAALLIVVWYILVSSLIDIDHMIIPDELTKGMQPVAPFLALFLAPAGLFTYASWPMQSWIRVNDFDGRPRLMLSDATWSLLGTFGLVAVLLLLSLPLARWIYSNHVPSDQRWRDEDHRAFRIGVLWFIAAMVPTVVVLALTGLFAGNQPEAWRIWVVVVLGQALLGSLCGWLLPYLVGLGGTMAFRRNAMGYGDVKFLAPLGAVLGPIGVLYCFLLAACLGTLIGVPMRLLGSGREIPFGPYLAGGALIALVVGPVLHNWIFSGLFA